MDSRGDRGWKMDKKGELELTYAAPEMRMPFDLVAILNCGVWMQ